MTSVLKENKSRQAISIKEDQQEKKHDRIHREAIHNLSDKAVIEIARMAGISVTIFLANYGLMLVSCCMMGYEK